MLELFWVNQQHLLSGARGMGLLDKRRLYRYGGGGGGFVGKPQEEFVVLGG